MCFKVPLYFRLFKFRHIKVYSKVNKYPLQNRFLLHLQTGYLLYFFFEKLFVWNSALDSYTTVKQSPVLCQKAQIIQNWQNYIDLRKIKKIVFGIKSFYQNQFCQFFFQRVSQMMLLDMKKIIRMGHSKSLTFLTAPFGFFQMHNYQIHYELSKPIWPRQASSGPFGTTNCTQMAVVFRATAPLVILYL